jgi:hypothetical protein
MKTEIPYVHVDNMEIEEEERLTERDALMLGIEVEEQHSFAEPAD